MAMAVPGKKESRLPFAVSVLQTGFHVKNHGRGEIQAQHGTVSPAAVAAVNGGCAATVSIRPVQ